MRLLLGVALAASSLVALTTPIQADATSPFSRMGWLEGSWGGESEGMQLEEHWTSANGDGLVGMHKDVRAGKMVSFEFFRIEPHQDGIYYMTSPRGIPATPFKLVSQEPRRLVFENKKHDFPQRILYWSDREGELSARIEGTLNGRAESMEWHWKLLNTPHTNR